MKKLLLVLAAFILSCNFASAKNDKHANEDELLRKSVLGGLPNTFQFAKTSFPIPFAETSQQFSPQNAAISTGYYWIDSQEKLDSKIFPGVKPEPTFADTSYQSELWRKIVVGPRIFPKAHWDNNPEGKPFFRQPSDLNFYNNPSDSTDEAIAGPIPIGIRGGFYFNGIRYDSFYVSTNGLVTLTNRRYFYDANGNRVIPAGATSCYDPMSMDWFAGGVRGHDTMYTVDQFGNRVAVRDANGNIVYNNGLNDVAPDNFGYQFAVLGQDPTNPTSYNPSIKDGGTRSKAGDFNSLNDNCKAAVIGVFWGDLVLSQYEPVTKQRDEHGTAWYKRTYTSDSLIVAYFNAQPKGALNGPFGGGTIDADIRPTTTNDYVSGNAHVVLSAKDSSITIHFSRLSDGWNFTYRKTMAREVFRYNTACGVRGFARHTNFGKGGLVGDNPWAGEYEQTSIYFQKFADNNIENRYPDPSTAVKFKQWQNSLRVADIQYRVRSLDPEAENPDDFVKTIPSTEVENYELLAGHDRLGAIQPVALIQNLTNEIQGPSGVNFVKQSLNFRGRFQIKNVITDRTIYNRLVPVDALCMGLSDADAFLCNGDPTVRVKLGQSVTVSGGNYTFNPVADFKSTGFNGVPPYYFVQIQFPPFEANEFIINHIGRMRATIVAEPINPQSGEKLRDNWPWDDSSKVTFFVMNRFYDANPNINFRQFEDDGGMFHQDTETKDIIPSAWKWININANMVSGDIVSKYPLPPRKIDTNANYWLYDRDGNKIGEGGNGGTTNPITLKSPVINMNRLQIDGNSEPLPKYLDKRGFGGDEIRSFPIDLRGKQNPVLSLSVQRTAHKDDWARGYSDNVLVGPEPRIVFINPPGSTNVLYTYTPGNSVGNTPDELVVEYAKPTSDNINDITNIKLENWRHLPFKRGTKDAALTDMAALTVYGAGGYLTAFLESNKDSILKLPATPDKMNSLRADEYDDGIDWDYKKYSVPIPDTLLLWKNGGAKYFRFRIKVYATNDKKCADCIEDDADDFFVDNVKILYRAEVTDVEVTSVKVTWPFTMAPASQATAIPITVRLSNNTDIDASVFGVKVKIFRVDVLGNLLDKYPIYCRTLSVTNLTRRGTIDLDMPTWDARRSQKTVTASYRLFASIVMSSPDLVSKNDTTYSDFTLTFGDAFAYDPVTNEPTNSVANELGGARGLNFLVPTNASGQPRSGGGTGWDAILDRGGVPGGNASGNIAVKFNLLNTDTLRGFSIYWAAQNQAADQVTFRLYDGNEQTPSTNVLLSAVTERGGPNFQNRYNQYVDYFFSKPVVLAKGVYWIGISQDGSTGYELGASGSRSGMRIIRRFTSQQGVWGESAIALNIDKNFRRVVNGNLVNNNFFAFQNLANAITWVPFTPAIGNPAFGHWDNNGNANDGTQAGRPTWTSTTGSYIPMFRPYFGPKSYGEAADAFEICTDDVPVELVSFNGAVRESGIDLFWETASEQENYGFYVERKVLGNSEFESIGFVPGTGNSSTIQRYNFFDPAVTANQTYEYRLRQVDKDGSQNCGISNSVILTFDKVASVLLEQNAPNPFVNSTMIKFNLPVAQNARLDVIDMYGNVVKTLVDGYHAAAGHNVVFDGTDANGNVLANGQYIYRLTTDNGIVNGKMTIVR
ncbi:MAG TPA: FlgD immunoglobulin-like domain containing protein [Candidatus Kapabacteria bacterium]|nr:FlgD immunoglobulin-like domain containing protein [Candidatus Kapabacteria bacterium]